MISSARRFVRILAGAALLLGSFWAQSSAGGLGVTRADVQQAFEGPPFEMSFTPSSPIHNNPRVTGQTSDGMAFVELIGPAGNLSTVGCLIGVPNNSPRVVAQNSMILLVALKKALPAWDRSGDWLPVGLEEAVENGKAQTTFRQTAVRILFLKEMGMLTLTVDAD